VIEGANHFFNESIDELVMHMHDHMNRYAGGRKVTAGLIEAA
jgi:hypothetical protein